MNRVGVAFCDLGRHKTQFAGLIYAALLLLSSVIACAGWLNRLFPSTHDYLCPVYMLMDFDSALKDGNLIVNWLPHAAGGGQPIFDYYPPLAYYVSELIHLIGLSYADSIRCTIILSYFISGCFIFILVNKLTYNGNAALISALAYIFFPYHLVDSHLRGDLAETFAFIFLPIIFYYLYEAMDRDDFLSSSIFAGISYAFLILTHIFVGYMLSIFVFILFMHKIITRAVPPKKLLFIFLAFGCSALVISSFYWLPALLERSQVNFSVITSENFHIGNNYIEFTKLIMPSEWKPGGSGPGICNTMPLGLGIFSILTFVFILYLLLAGKFLDENIYFFFVCFSVSCLFTTKYGLVILNLIPLMENIQFPWRFLIVTAFASSVLAGYLTEYLLRNFKNKFTLFIFICFVIGPSCYMTSIPEGYLGKEPTVDDVVTFSRDEYFPAYNGTVYRTLPKDYPDIIYSGQYVLTQKRSTYWKANTFSDVALDFEAKIFYSPRWKCFLDGIEAKLYVSKMGTIYLNVPSGDHIIEFKYSDTSIRTFSKVLTILGLIVLILIFMRNRLKRTQTSQRIL